MSVEADEKGEERGAGQGRGRDHANLERPVPECGEVGRQQQADQSVSEGTKSAACQQKPGLRRGARREQAPPPPPIRARRLVRQHQHFRPSCPR